MSFSIQISAWNEGEKIPAKFAFGKPGEDGPFAFGGNVSPEIKWSNAPEGTRSYVLIVHDSKVPSAADDVNQEGKIVSADLPRVDFDHWVLVNIPAHLSELPEGAGGNGITARGKEPGETPFGLTGKNNYTEWFAGDPDMEGVYGGYDGPCPPWNDSIIHLYHFTLYALSVEALPMSGTFTREEVLKEMSGSILAETSYTGTYSMNPDVN